MKAVDGPCVQPGLPFVPLEDPEDDGSMLSTFHPAVRSWFKKTFPKGPTAPQSAAWPVIASGLLIPGATHEQKHVGIERMPQMNEMSARGLIFGSPPIIIPGGPPGPP